MTSGAGRHSEWRPKPDVTPETVRNRLLSWYLTSPFNISKCSTLPEISEKVVWTWSNGATWFASVTQFRRSDSAPRGDVTRRPAAGAGRSGSGVRGRADGPDWWVSVTGRLLAPDAGCLWSSQARASPWRMEEDSALTFSGSAAATADGLSIPSSTWNYERR